MGTPGSLTTSRARRPSPTPFEPGFVTQVAPLCRTGATAPPRSTTASARSWSTAGTFTKLDEAKRPNSYWAHSDPGDVARVEDRTFICSEPRSTPAPPTTGGTPPR
jgi:hypothetical protein